MQLVIGKGSVLSGSNLLSGKSRTVTDAKVR